MKKSDILTTLCQFDGDLIFTIIAFSHPNSTKQMKIQAIKNLCQNQEKIQEIYSAIKNSK